MADTPNHFEQVRKRLAHQAGQRATSASQPERCDHEWERRSELIRRDLTAKQENARFKANKLNPGHDLSMTLSATVTYEKCMKCGIDQLIDYVVN